MIIPDEQVVVKFTDYAVNSPDFFIDFIKKEIRKRDVRGLTNNRINAINVTGEHPLVTLTANVLSGTQLNVSAVIPAIAVIEDEENETDTNLGDGYRRTVIFTQETVEELRKLAVGDARFQEGIISDAQIDAIEQALANVAHKSKENKGYLLTQVDGWLLRETICVSLWCHSVDERSLIGDVLRSILYDMKNAMRVRKLKDVSIRTSKGLVNTNFGTVLFGQETLIDFTNFFHTITVTNQFPSKIMLAESGKISIFDVLNDSYEELSQAVRVREHYRAIGTQDYADVPEYDDDEEV